MAMNVTGTYVTGIIEPLGKCIPHKSAVLVALLAVLVILIFENMFFSVTVAMYRHKLKNSIIYLYVFSGLVANVVYCLLYFYHYLNQYVGFQHEGGVELWAIERGEEVKSAIPV